MQSEKSPGWSVSHRRWVVCECVSGLQKQSASQYAVKVLAVAGNKCLVEWGVDKLDKDSFPGEVIEDFDMNKMSKWDTLYKTGKSLTSHSHTADWQLAGR